MGEVEQVDIDAARGWWEASDQLRLTDAAKLAQAFTRHRLLGEGQGRVAEREAIAELLESVLLTLRHARVFTRTREKMHPEGQGLYDEEISAVETCLAAIRTPTPANPIGGK